MGNQGKFQHTAHYIPHRQAEKVQIQERETHQFMEIVHYKAFITVGRPNDTFFKGARRGGGTLLRMGRNLPAEKLLLRRQAYSLKCLARYGFHFVCHTHPHVLCVVKAIPPLQCSPIGADPHLSLCPKQKRWVGLHSRLPKGQGSRGASTIAAWKC